MLDALLNLISNGFGDAQQWLFESVFQPLLFALGMGQFLEDGFVATGWLLVGLLQLAVMVVVFGAFERWRPVEAVRDRAAVRVDMIYTFIHRLGVFRVALFFLVEPLVDAVFGWARVQGVDGIHLDALVAHWQPGVTDAAWFSLVLYLLVFDFVDYWIHRGQHGLNRWWA